MTDPFKFRGVTEVGNALLSDQLETNLYAWLNHCLLQTGAFFNITIPPSGYSYPYSAPQHRLRPVDDPNYDAGQVWEGFRKDWVWETGVDYRIQPIRVSGVYVQGDFYPLAETGVYAHHVEYPLGRVVFDSAIPATSVVTCEFSPRLYQVYTADTPFWQEFQTDSFRADDPTYLLAGSGNWGILGANRVQLPAVVIEADFRTDRYPYEIGAESQIVKQDVLFHVFAETRTDAKRLHDALTYQKDKTIRSFDVNAVPVGAAPLDENGTPGASGFMYPDLVDNFGWRLFNVVGVRSSPEPRTGRLFRANVRWTVEVDSPE